MASPADIAERLRQPAREVLALMAAGRHIGGSQAAALARIKLAEYAEHVDAWHGSRPKGRRLTVRRGYTTTPLGDAVAATFCSPWSIHIAAYHRAAQLEGIA